MSTNSDEILAIRQGVAMRVILNRPAALNALSHKMIQRLAAGISEWEKDPNVQVVIFEGAGGKAFCAGGDIKSTWANRDEVVLNDRYFYDEYRLNRQLFHYSKPLVALMDGITMGGGYGVAGPCRYRIATENTKWAMPETGIGFFPDIGSAYSLQRAPGAMGMCLALTGMTIGAEDAVYGGFATHYVDADVLKDLVTMLEAGDVVMDRFHRQPSIVGPLQQHHDVIDRCFGGDSVIEIVSALAQETSEWAQTTLALLHSRSPLGVAVTYERMKRARGQSFDQIIEQDYDIARHFMRGDEFFEGVRAMLIDKDKNPHWNPDTLDKVTETAVLSHFMDFDCGLNDEFKS